jgi:hypothetical protein
MKIQWNKVTWYSQLLAIILFVLAFYIGFYLGEQKAKIGTINEVPQKQTLTKTTPISIKIQNIEEENFSGTKPIISGSSLLAVQARAYVEQKITEFRTQANTDVPDMRKKFGADSPPATYTIDIGATYIKGDKTESIEISVYAYTGGAHGNDSYKVITAISPNGKILSLSEIIKQDKQTAFTEFIKKELNDWRPEGSDTSVVFADTVKDLKFSSFVNWSLDDKNLTIYFDKYEIGPGALGAVVFPLSLDKIRDFLNTNFSL